MDLTSYRTLGQSGLVISPMALGTMTFGTQRWGAEDEASSAIFNAYTEAGGNFIDTADIYAGGRSEEMVGACIAERSLRDKMVLATKFTWNLDPGNPNAGGNGRKNIQRALNASLKRLGTDYIDLYWMHFWDMVTPVEEVLQTLGDLVRAGKIRYFALSDVPAWYAVKMAVLAQARGVPGPIALQLEYSLVERTVENEHVPAAHECGLGITPWSPLAGGFLAGKYQRQDDGATGQGRLNGANPFGDTKFTDRNWKVLDALRQVAAQTPYSPAQVALAWISARPGVTSLLLGASKPEQLLENIAAMAIVLTAEQIETLNKASAQDAVFPYSAFGPQVKRMIFGGTAVDGWQANQM